MPQMWSLLGLAGDLTSNGVGKGLSRNGPECIGIPQMRSLVSAIETINP